MIDMTSHCLVGDQLESLDESFLDDTASDADCRLVARLSLQILSVIKSHAFLFF